MTLPTVSVHLDDGTGTFPHDISAFAMLGPGFNFNRGRQDWTGPAATGTLSLTLNNSDGRFTVGSTLIASPSPIKVDQRIRVREKIGPSTYNRYVGYVKSWPVDWPAVVVTFATSSLTATDAQARAERHILRSFAEEEILLDDPVAYYILGEPEGATSVGDSSGNQAPVLRVVGSGADIAFGAEGSGASDGVTAATFGGGKYLSGSGMNLTTAGLLLAFKVAPGSATMSLVSVTGLATGAPFIVDIQIDDDGLILADVGASSLYDFVTDWADNQWHVAEIRISGSDSYLYIDGVQRDASAGSASTVTLDRIDVAGITATATIGHVAVFSSTQSPTRIAAHADAILDGFAGESGTERIQRLAGYAGLAIGGPDTSLTDVPFGPIAGGSAWDAISKVAEAELGAVFVGPTGLKFYNRNRVPMKSGPDLTIAANLYVSPDVKPVDDDQQMVNYLEVTSDATRTSQLVRNPTSETAHGRYADSRSYLVTTDTEALDRGNWVINNFAEPTTRYGTLTLNLLSMPTVVASLIIADLDVFSWLRIENLAAQNPTGSRVDVVVQGFIETVTADTWSITCNVVSRSLYEVAILNDSIYGVLDSPATRLYV